MEGQQQTTDKAAADASAGALVEQGLGRQQQQQPPKNAAEGAAAGGKKEGDAAAATAQPQQQQQPAPEGFVSRADVQKLIDDALNSRAAQNESMNTRERFIREKMSDLPLSFQNLMPKTGDVGELAKAEQTLRGELVAWFNAAAKNAGMRPLNIGGGNFSSGEVPSMQGRGPATAGGKTTSTDLVTEGLRRAPSPQGATQYAPPENKAAAAGPRRFE